MNRVQNLKSKSALLLCELTFLLGLELTDTHRDSGYWEARVCASVYWNDNAMWIKYAPPLPIQFRIILFSLFFIPPSTLGQRASQQNTRPLYGDHAFKRAPFFPLVCRWCWSRIMENMYIDFRSIVSFFMCWPGQVTLWSLLANMNNQWHHCANRFECPV